MSNSFTWSPDFDWKARLSAIHPDAEPWGLILDSDYTEEEASIRELMEMVDSMLRTAGTGFSGVHMRADNDPGLDSPAWERTEDGYFLHLACESGLHWTQVAFQLGSLMTRCLIDHLEPDTGKAVPWAENLICLTAGYYAVQWLQESWDSLSFSECEDLTYSWSIEAALEKAFEKDGTSALRMCGSREELICLCVPARYTDADYLDEAQDLFYRLVKGDLCTLAGLRKFSDGNGLTLNTPAFRHDAFHNPAVRYLCLLQDRIPGCGPESGVSHNIDLIGVKSVTPEYLEQYGNMVRLLRPLRDEYASFSLMSTWDEIERPDGLETVCFAAEDPETIRAEMRFNVRRRQVRRARSMSREDAVALARKVLAERAFTPDASWKGCGKEDACPREPLHLAPDDVEKYEDLVVQGESPADALEEVLKNNPTLPEFG